MTYSRVNVNEPFIAITFDDGPHASNTPRLLDIPDEGRRVLAGDYCYAQGLARVTDAGDLVVIDLLSALISEGSGLAARRGRGVALLPNRQNLMFLTFLLTCPEGVLTLISLPWKISYMFIEREEFLACSLSWKSV